MTFEPVHQHDDRPYEWVSSLGQRRATLTPDAPAVTDLHEERTWTYAELDAMSNRCARLLEDADVSAGDRIAVISRNRIEVVELFFAAMKRGAILAPLSHRLAPPELAELLDLVGPQMLIFEDRFEELVDLDTVDAQPYRLTDSSESEPVIPSYTKALSDDDSTVESTHRALSDPILLLHTGGSTGTPKEVVITYGSMLWNSLNTITGWGLRPDDVTPMVFPFFHTGGWNVLTLPFFHHGGHVLIDRLVDPVQILETIDSHDASILVAVPTVLRSMVDHDSFESADLSSLRLVKSGGGPCREEVIDAWRKRGIDISQGYGLTECGPNNFGMPPEGGVERPDSIGLPMPHVDARIVDDDGQVVPEGSIGELELASPHAADRYWQNESETQETFGDGWVSTGDLAYSEDGFFYIEGRKKHMFVSGGENVYPGEVEAAIAEHPGVDEVVVLGVPDDEWGEVGHAIIEGDQTLQLSDLRTFLDGRLARFKHPHHLDIVAEMPTSGPDKIDRQTLRDRVSGTNR